MVGRYLYILSLLFLLSSNGYSQSDSLSLKVYRDNILPSPTFTYSPKTDVVVGLYLLYQFKFDKKDYSTRPSNINFYVGSSYRGQNYLSSEHTVLTNKEKFYLKGIIEYKNTPERLYAIGPTSNDAEYLNADYESFEFKERVLRQYDKSKFLGVRLRYIQIFNISYKEKDGSPTSVPDYNGTNGGYYPGIGPVWMLDKRNSILTPTENYYLDVVAVGYKNSNGGGFGTLEVDGRKYLDLKSDGRKVLAFQLLSKNTFGEVPFNELALLGGKQILRGYTLGRYRDKNSIQAQAEFRKHLIGRFGMTAFVGTGTVYEELSDLKHLKAALGSGIRFNINRKDPTNVRVDFAWSLTDKNNGIYITLGEAF